MTTVIGTATGDVAKQGHRPSRQAHLNPQARRHARRAFSWLRGRRPAGLAGKHIRAEGEGREIVADAFVRAVLFINLQHPRVFLVARRKNLRGFARQKNRGVGAMPINHATNNNHEDGNEAQSSYFASGKLCFNVWIAPSGCNSLA